jgi:septum formation protein
VRLLLASASPRRADLLRAAGFSFDVHAAHVDERALPGETPSDYVVRLARDKARAAPIMPAHVVLGADTTVVAGDEMLAKPESPDDARRMIRLLAGRRHEVLTGVAVRSGAREFTGLETTWVEFAPLSDDEIAWYVDSGEPDGKAGGYAIQGLASRFVTRVDGSYSNVVGLPVALVYRLLVQVGWREVERVDPTQR